MMGGTMNGSLPGWIIVTQFASRAVLFILLGLSVWSVSIMVDRSRVLKSAASGALDEARKLIAARDWKALARWTEKSATENQGNLMVRLPAGALAAALETGSASSENIDRAVRSYLSSERSRLENGLTTLATLGSNAPFIGLFGTVLGIIQAFGALAAQNTSTTSVMTGISEALVATAIGLFVAIPAVVAYNIFSRRTRLALSESDSLRDYYLSRLEPASGARHGS
jgi:biopolymer transport protein ExbB/TolQ